MRGTNGRVQRARAVDATQVKTAFRGLRLQPFVLSDYSEDTAILHRV